MLEEVPRCSFPDGLRMPSWYTARVHRLGTLFGVTGRWHAELRRFAQRPAPGLSASDGII